MEMKMVIHWRTHDLIGAGIGFESRKELTRSSSEKLLDISNDVKKKNQTGELNTKDSDFLLEPMNRSTGCRKFRLKCDLRGKKPLLSQSGDGNCAGVLEPEMQSTPLPNSFKELLLDSGWMVVSRDCVGEAVYVSPSGYTYGSLPKALEAFSGDIFKSTEQSLGLSPLVDIGGLASNHASSGADFSSKIERFDNFLEPTHRRRKFSSKTNRKEQLDEGTTMKSSAHGDGNFCMVDGKTRFNTKDAQFRGDSAIQAVSNMGQSSNNDDENLLSLRRSVRINGKHVPVHFELDFEMEADVDAYLESFKWVPADLLLQPKEIGPGEKFQEAVSSCMKGHKKTKSHIKKGCSNNEAKSSDCSRAEVEAKNLDYCRAEDTKIEGNNNNEMHQDGKLLGVRRSVRINGKHVPVDCDFDMIMEAGDEYLDSSKCAIHRLGKKGIETLMTQTLKLKNVECRMPIVGKKSTKQTCRKKFNCLRAVNKELENQGMPSRRKSTSEKSNGRKEKSNGRKSHIFDKFSLSKRNKGKSLIPEKHTPSYTSKRKPLGGWNSNGKKRKKKRSGGCSLTVRRIEKGDYQEKLWCETGSSILSWLIDAGTLAENAKVMYRKNCGNILEGQITRGGIWCDCCKKVFSLLAFEAHAGSDLRRPWDNTYLDSGKLLLLCLIEAWEKEKAQRKVGFLMVGINDPDPTDDTCGVCADGGSLICCDSCPSTFHQDCVKLKVPPEGRWCCPYCRCAFCVMAERGEDRSTENFMLLTCVECGCRYHRECAWGHDMLMMGAESLSFCGKYCMKVAKDLMDMLGVTNPIEGGFSWTLLRRLDEDQGIDSDRRLSFIMECNAKLCMSLSVLEAGFDPLLDRRSGLDMISQAVYNCGSNYRRLNYERFHTVILEKDGEIISVATLRIHGTRSAEMPFIGTRPMYQQQGMCRRLLKAIEEMLSSLYVEKLIIPAIPDLLETWMMSFSFKPLELSHREGISNLSMIVFAETTMLQKSIFNMEMEDERGCLVNPHGQDVLLQQGPERSLLGCRNTVFGSCEEFEGYTSVSDSSTSCHSNLSCRST